MNKLVCNDFAIAKILFAVGEKTEGAKTVTSELIRYVMYRTARERAGYGIGGQMKWLQR
jgi:hypothetical protein